MTGYVHAHQAGHAVDCDGGEPEWEGGEGEMEGEQTDRERDKSKF